MKVHLQENEPGYRLFLYIFYACAVIMASATVFGIIATLQEWSEKGNYVLGEVLVKTEFPTPHFAKLTTWLFFATIIGWYCVSRIGWKKTVQVSSWKITLVQLMVLGFCIVCLYETLYNFVILGSQITAGIVNGKLPNIDSLTVAYPDPQRPWNLIFATKMFLAATLISGHAFYLSTRPRKSINELDA